MTNQRGALFGLDARIALAIFSGLSVITGVALSSRIDFAHSGALVDEIKKIATAAEGMHYDMERNIFKILNDASPANAFLALIDEEQLILGQHQAKWLGPYVDFQTNIHPRYKGEMALHNRSETYASECSIRSICYLWLSLEKVPIGTIESVNNSFDGTHELDPSTSGRLQWQLVSAEADTSTLWFRIGKAL